MTEEERELAQVLRVEDDPADASHEDRTNRILAQVRRRVAARDVLELSTGWVWLMVLQMADRFLGLFVRDPAPSAERDSRTSSGSREGGVNT